MHDRGRLSFVLDAGTRELAKTGGILYLRLRASTECRQVVLSLQPQLLLRKRRQHLRRFGSLIDDTRRERSARLLRRVGRHVVRRPRTVPRSGRHVGRGSSNYEDAEDSQGRGGDVRRVHGLETGHARGSRRDYTSMNEQSLLTGLHE